MPTKKAKTVKGRARTTKKKRAKRESPRKESTGKKSTKKKRPLHRAQSPVPVELMQNLVTTTFRLPAELVSELRMAATRRRNQYAPPYTQGAIVEAALREWLERNGGD